MSPYLTEEQFCELHIAKQTLFYNRHLYYNGLMDRSSWIGRLIIEVEKFVLLPLPKHNVVAYLKGNLYSSEIIRFATDYLAEIHANRLNVVNNFKTPQGEHRTTFIKNSNIAPLHKMSQTAMDYCFEQFYIWLKTVRSDVVKPVTKLDEIYHVAPCAIPVNNIHGVSGFMTFTIDIEICSCHYMLHYLPKYIEWIEPFSSPARFSKVSLPICEN